ncbi:L-tyrosine:2-oxoglutarate aminotransferase [Cubamyces lactineus]|nr:L-tyrosine:2-oxoglutarate aminotransferase [Cubamyces lactineus]
MAAFIDLAHHLSPETLARRTNPLKDVLRIAIENPQLVTLANGDPHPSRFPIRRVDFEIASVAADDPVAGWISLRDSAPSQVLSTSQDDDLRTLLNSSLQYGHGAGLRDALRIVDDINNTYHNAPNHVSTMTLGNADAITKCLRMLGAPGDHFLADEFTFLPMPLAGEAHGIKWVPVTIDAGGIIPEELERILANWDPERGRRPHVLYITPSGQNPTGSTLDAERRTKIYAIAHRYDLIILEDDPYFFLQYDLPQSSNDMFKPPAPSFLSMDVDGRVIRIDSFSKIMAPGMRLGWITSSPSFRDHLVKFIDLSTQNPAGFAQVLIVALLGPHGGWQLSGFDRWVRSLCADYQRRRDFFAELFEREVASTGLASAYTPAAGMFFWIRVHLEKHPRFKNDAEAGSCNGLRVAKTNTVELMKELFDACLACGLVICPSSIFALRADPRYDDVPSSVDDRSNFVRATFAGSEEAIAAGVPLLGKALKQFFA